MARRDAYRASLALLVATAVAGACHSGTGSGVAGIGGSDSGIDGDASLPDGAVSPGGGDGAIPESDGGPGTLEDAGVLAPCEDAGAGCPIGELCVDQAGTWSCTATANCGTPVSSYTGPPPAPATWSDAEQACLSAASEGVDTRVVQNSCAGHVAYVVVGASALTSFVYERATGALVSVLGQSSLGYSCIAGQVNISKVCVGPLTSGTPCPTQIFSDDAGPEEDAGSEDAGAGDGATADAAMADAATDASTD